MEGRHSDPRIPVCPRCRTATVLKAENHRLACRRCLYVGIPADFKEWQPRPESQLRRKVFRRQS
jgi:tRNA(Ile2) C34 agmatinyltransferase TiaS